MWERDGSPPGKVAQTVKPFTVHDKSHAASLYGGVVRINLDTAVPVTTSYQ